MLNLEILFQVCNAELILGFLHKQNVSKWKVYIAKSINSSSMYAQSVSEIGFPGNCKESFMRTQI